MSDGVHFLQDLQASPPDVRIGLSRAGVSGVRKAIRIRYGESEKLISADIDCTVDLEATQRAVTAQAQCALRHGGLELVDVTATGPELTIAPITPASAPVVLGEDLRDLGAAVAALLVRALGGSVSVEDETLHVRLPE
jgi:hypothetical protein